MTFESEKTGIPPEEEPVTSRDEAGEPSGEEDPANEQQGMEDKEAVSEEPETSEQPEDYLALAQRIQADFENYRKRAAREAAAAVSAPRAGSSVNCSGGRQPRARARLRRGGRTAPRGGSPVGALE